MGESIEIIPGFFNFTYVRNTGAAFGFGAGAHDWFRIAMFLALPVLACFWLLHLMWKERHGCVYLATAYALILAGAIGNLIDRFTLRYVVDSLDHRSHSDRLFKCSRRRKSCERREVA